MQLCVLQPVVFPTRGVGVHRRVSVYEVGPVCDDSSVGPAVSKLEQSCISALRRLPFR